MNIKTEQKKDYLKPQMTVLEYEFEGALLSGSDTCENCDDSDDDVVKVRFLD